MPSNETYPHIDGSDPTYPVTLTPIELAQKRQHGYTLTVEGVEKVLVNGPKGTILAPFRIDYTKENT